MVSIVTAPIDSADNALGIGFLLVGSVKTIQYFYYVYLYFRYPRMETLLVTPCMKELNRFEDSKGLTIYPSLQSLLPEYRNSRSNKNLALTLRSRSTATEKVQLRMYGKSYFLDRGSLRVLPAAYALLIAAGICFLISQPSRRDALINNINGTTRAGCPRPGI